MKLSLLLTFLSYSYVFIVASPVPVNSLFLDTPSITKRAATWKLEDLNNEFKGINWELAVNPDNCSPDQLDKLVYTTRYALKLVKKPTPDSSFANSPAFNRYFGHMMTWLSFGEPLRTKMSHIHQNIRQVQTYPEKGPKLRIGQEKITTGQRVWYSCQPTMGGKSCSPKTGAITLIPGKTTHNAWEIYFCPLFFDGPRIRYLEEVTNETPQGKSEAGDIETRERLMAHEWMHVKRFGYGDFIDDIKGELPGMGNQLYPIYGEYMCAKFAQTRLPRANPDTVINADTYSWFFQYYWFDDKWGWGEYDNVNKKRDDTNPLPDLPDSGVTHSFPANADDVEPSEIVPLNCQMEEVDGDPLKTTVHCDPIGDTYEDWVANLDEPFMSEEGCVLSSECHRADSYAANAMCTCKCGDDNPTPLSDARCAGFAGSHFDLSLPPTASSPWGPP